MHFVETGHIYMKACTMSERQRVIEDDQTLVPSTHVSHPSCKDRASSLEFTPRMDTSLLSNVVFLMGILMEAKNPFRVGGDVLFPTVMVAQTHFVWDQAC